MPDSHDPRMAPLGERGFGALVAELTRAAARLVRQEIALARAEYIDRMGIVGPGLAFCAVGAGAIFAGGLALVGAAGLALALALPAWAAALLVAGIVMPLGAALLHIGWRELSGRGVVPRRTRMNMR
jgi:hypothetical protein